MRLGKGQLAAAEIAEHKPGAGVGRLLQRLDAVVEQQEHLRRRWKFSSSTAAATCSTSPAAATRTGTRNQSSLIAQAISSNTAIPNTPRMIPRVPVPDEKNVVNAR